MTIAVISDIHGNLEALETSLKYIDDEKVEKIYCLGDVVGYGPNPNECVDLVRKRCEITLMGNHDYAAIGLANINYFNDFARIATFWTQEVLNDDNMHFLKTLPFSYEEDAFSLVHASPVNPSYWNYILSHAEARKNFGAFETAVCFIGHSHVPVLFSEDEMTRDLNRQFDGETKYIVNVGSVGQPRDGDSRCSFVIYDTDSRELKHIRLEYDIQTTYKKITRAGLPIFLAERLLKGY